MPNSVLVGGRIFHDAENHRLENLTATQVLAQSSNIGTYEIGTRVGENGLLAQVQRLGFGQMTAVNFPGETAGLLVDAAKWYASDQVALPIGQVDAVPPIQVLDAYNTIANGGTFVEPSLVRGYVEPNGITKAVAPSVTRQALTPAVATTMNKMLQAGGPRWYRDQRHHSGLHRGGQDRYRVDSVPGQGPATERSVQRELRGVRPREQPRLVDDRGDRTTRNDHLRRLGGRAGIPASDESYALRHYGIPSSGTIVKPLTGAGASIASDVT